MGQYHPDQGTRVVQLPGREEEEGSEFHFPPDQTGKVGQCGSQGEDPEPVLHRVEGNGIQQGYVTLHEAERKS